MHVCDARGIPVADVLVKVAVKEVVIIYAIGPSPVSSLKRHSMLVTPDVSHVEMWPHASRRPRVRVPRRDCRPNRAVVRDQGVIVGAGVAVGAMVIVGAGEGAHAPSTCDATRRRLAWGVVWRCRGRYMETSLSTHQPRFWSKDAASKNIRSRL